MTGHPSMPKVKQLGAAQKFRPNDQTQNAKRCKNQPVIIPGLSAPVGCNRQTDKTKYCHQSGFPLTRAFQQNEKCPGPNQPAIVGIVFDSTYQAIPQGIQTGTLNFFGIEENILVEIDGEKVIQCAIDGKVSKHHRGDCGSAQQKLSDDTKEFSAQGGIS